MSRQKAGEEIKILTAPILPELPSAVKRPFLGERRSFVGNRARLGGSNPRQEEQCSPINSLKPPPEPARSRLVDETARLSWRGLAEGHIGEADATAISETVEVRRARIKAGRPQPLPRPACARRRPPRSPDRARSIERRRRQAASGAMPPAIASSFTTGEAAVLAVVAREVQRSGRCEFYLDKIAALAGVCRSTAQNALHEARRLGLVTVTERRRRGAKSLTNVIEVVSAAWREWLRIGSKNFDTTGKDFKITDQSALRPTAKRETDAPSARTSYFWRRRPPR